MHINKAKQLANYHNFTKLELYTILVDALNELDVSYWSKPNQVNKMFDNGYYFNRCRDWLGYEHGINDNDSPKVLVTVRILTGFGKFSKTQVPIKKRGKIELKVSEKPTLDI